MNRVFQTETGIFGEGAPKICVPIVEKSREGIWKKAEDIEKLPVDIAEWRVFMKIFFGQRRFWKP